MNFVTQKRGEARDVVDERVDACIAAASIGPGADLIEKTISNGQVLVRAGFKEAAKGKQDAGGKERKEQDGRAWNGKPSRGQAREEQNEKCVTGYGQPIDERIQMI
ncbi:MAG TPA: hypothetical protein VHW70_02190 [Edaphobacter sp.]|nr:hypothetical protein [Edaphobacter sp.]